MSFEFELDFELDFDRKQALFFFSCFTFAFSIIHSLFPQSFVYPTFLQSYPIQSNSVNRIPIQSESQIQSVPIPFISKSHSPSLIYFRTIFPFFSISPFINLNLKQKQKQKQTNKQKNNLKSEHKPFNLLSLSLFQTTKKQNKTQNKAQSHISIQFKTNSIQFNSIQITLQFQITKHNNLLQL